jgi:hypothetical protein
VLGEIPAWNGIATVSHCILGTVVGDKGALEERRGDGARLNLQGNGGGEGGIRGGDGERGVQRERHEISCSQ